MEIISLTILCRLWHCRNVDQCSKSRF